MVKKTFSEVEREELEKEGFEIDEFNTLTQFKNWRDDVKVVIVPEGVQTIGEKAFEDCENFERVELPSTLKSIGKRAFGYSGIGEKTARSFRLVIH